MEKWRKLVTNEYVALKNRRGERKGVNVVSGESISKFGEEYLSGKKTHQKKKLGQNVQVVFL